MISSKSSMQTGVIEQIVIPAPCLAFVLAQGAGYIAGLDRSDSSIANYRYPTEILHILCRYISYRVALTPVADRQAGYLILDRPTRAGKVSICVNFSKISSEMTSPGTPLPQTSSLGEV